MDHIYNIIQKIAKKLNNVSQILIFLIMVIMVVNIIGRVLFNSPIKGVYDILMLAYIVLISFSIAQCAVEDGHVYVDFLMDKFPVKVQKIIDFIMKTVCSIFFITIGCTMMNYAKKVRLQGKTTMTTFTSHYPFVYMIAFGLFLLAIVILLREISEQRKAGKNK